MAAKLTRQKSAALASGYARLLDDLKARVRAAQLKAALSANRELITLYWDIGRAIVEAQQSKGYGQNVVERLAADLSREFPEMTGFSERNLWFMRSFYLAYTDVAEILKQLASESPRRKGSRVVPKPASGNATLVAPNLPAPILKQLASELDGGNLPQSVAQIPWFHNVILVQKVKDPIIRLWYARKTVEHGWSRAVLVHQIETSLHKREGRAVSNFVATLPAPQSELAQQAIKDPYVFDFLTLSTGTRERELEQGLLDHIQRFLVELGAGFAFVGRQYPLEVADEDYYLDLLFYHLRLRCFVVIDLKMEAFKPEFAGKMNFLLSAVDDQLRHTDDKPSIGLLLCKANNRLTVEYALRDMRKPIGVAEWQTKLVESLPKNLQGSLPTVEQIEAELSGRERVEGNGE